MPRLPINLKHPSFTTSIGISIDINFSSTMSDNEHIANSATSETTKKQKSVRQKVNVAQKVKYHESVQKAIQEIERIARRLHHDFPNHTLQYHRQKLLYSSQRSYSQRRGNGWNANVKQAAKKFREGEAVCL